MSWIAIAGTIMALLAPFAAKAGEEVAKKMGEEVYNKLKERFQNKQDEDAQEVLDNYVRKPVIYEKTLNDVLAQRAENDPEDFGAFLKTLADKAGISGGVGGMTAIGSNIAQADRGSTANVNVYRSKDDGPDHDE